ncbi:MAG TPA: 50S ribosomal protein L17 [Thermoanaerobaculia bacterium]|nr:50S ribosomal protein L17 [Thermoanaerobaculia bacterium]
MRHAVKGRKLGRTSSHREALFRNQLQSLMENERIITTLPKAKELRPIAERVITRGKYGTVHDRRWVLRWVLSRDLVKKVFDDIAPRFSERAGGYLRIVKLGPRQGDGAEMAVLELVERNEAAAAEAPKETPKAAKPKKASPKKDAKADESKPAKAARSKKPAKDQGAEKKAPAKSKTGPKRGAARNLDKG